MQENVQDFLKNVEIWNKMYGYAQRMNYKKEELKKKKVLPEICEIFHHTSN